MRVLVLVLAAAAPAAAQSIITTFAGTDWLFPGDGKPALEAPLGAVGSLAVNENGEVLIADSLNHMVMKFRPGATLEVIAGNGLTLSPRISGIATSFSLTSPSGVAIDSEGNVLITDNYGVYRTAGGVIRSVGGSLSSNSRAIAVDRGGNIYLSQFSSVIRITPAGVRSTLLNRSATALAVDASGNLHIASTGCVEKLSSGGLMTTVAGQCDRLGFGGDNGLATRSLLGSVAAIAFDPAGNLYIADAGNHRLRRVGLDGNIATVAGNGQDGFSGDGGQATMASLSRPNAVAADAAGNLYAGDAGNSRVRRIAPDGTISTVAGNGAYRLSPDGTPATAGYLNAPRGIAFDSAGNLFISGDDARLRRVGRDGTLSTVASLARTAGFSGITDVAVDSRGNVFVIHALALKRIAADGTATTVRPGVTGSLAMDVSGSLYFSESSSNSTQIFKMTPAGSVTVVAGASAQLRNTGGMTVDAAGNVFVAATFSHRVLRIDATGAITTVAGNGMQGFSGDGGPATAARLSFPSDVALDAGGNLYISEHFRIRRVAPNTAISTFAGSDRFGFEGDGGPATSAGLGSPEAVAVDGNGNVYISDVANHRIRVVLRAAPSFETNPASLMFTAKSGGLETVPQNLGVFSLVAGLPFTLSARTSAGGDWLRTVPPAGNMPVAVQVSADPAGLAPGTYQATATIRAPSAAPDTRTVNVTFNVGPPDSARLRLEQEGLTFTFVEQARAAARQINVSNLGGGFLSFAASAATFSGGDWLALSPATGTASGAAPATVLVTARPGGLARGTYTGSVAISSSTTGETITVPVTMTVTDVQRTILLSQTGLTFTSVVNGGVVPPQNFGILNTGNGVMQWTVAASTVSGGPSWLAATPASGSSDAASINVPLVDVGVNPAGLAPGEYYGQIRVTAAEADNSPQFVSVVLQVLPEGANPGPVIRPTGLIFAAVAGGESTGSQVVSISNLSGRPLGFTTGRVTSDGSNWLVNLPTDGVATPTATARVVVQAEPGNLAPGIRRGALTLLFADGTARAVSVLFVLLPAQPGNPLRAAAGCRPTRLLPVFTSLSADFIVPAAWPNPLEVRVVDDCGDALTDGSVVATFSNGDAPVAMVSLKNGRWSGTWQVRNTRAPAVTIQIAADLPSAAIRGAAQLNGALRANQNPPVIASGAVVSAASFAARAPLSPGGMVSIFGTKLAERPAVSESLPLETNLAGTVAIIAGRPMPMSYASDGQINAVIPYGLAVDATHQIIVRRGGSYTVPEAVTIAAAQPAVFTRNQSGGGQGVILDTRFRYVEPGNAAASGDVVVLFATGLGEVAPPVAAGTAAPAEPLSRTIHTVSLTIGGVAAEVLFAGLAPGFAGLYQVNSIVPEGVTPGDAAAVVLRVAGQASPPVTMAVR